MMEKCYNKTYNKALRDGHLKGLLITTNCKELAMTTANNTRNIERGQSRKAKLIYGVGFNSKGAHKTAVNYKHTPTYVRWKNMLERCYSEKFQDRQPAYIGCSVADEWHDFQVFAEWCANHEHSDMGYCLDKDLLIPNNKIYSPSTCCFVPNELNVLLVNRAAKRGAYPQGVTAETRYGGFYARLKINGKAINLGRFDCPNKAYQAYKVAKEEYVKEKAIEWQDRIACNVFQSLMNWTLDS